MTLTPEGMKSSADLIDEVAKQNGEASHAPPHHLDEEGKLLPQPRPRLKPKAGLQAMSFYLMDLRLKLRLSTIRTPEDAAWVMLTLTPEDAEMLEDISDTLDFFYNERQRSSSGRR